MTTYARRPCSTRYSRKKNPLGWRLNELKKHAKNLKVTGYSGLNKDALCKKLANRTQEQDREVKKVLDKIQTMVVKSDKKTQKSLEKLPELKEIDAYRNRKGDPLHKHQKNALRLIVTLPHLLLHYKVGSGKTAAAVCAADYSIRNHPKETNGLIVVGPLSVKDQWENTIKDWKAHAAGRSYRYLTYSAFNRNPPNTNKKFLVFDEAHTLRSDTSQQTQKALKAVKSCSHLLLLTGTPIQNSPSEIQPLYRMLNPNVFNIPTKKAFEAQFGIDGLGDKKGLTKLHDPLKDVSSCQYLHYAPNENSEHFPKLHLHDPIYVPMTAQQLKLYGEKFSKKVRGQIARYFANPNAEKKNLMVFLNGPRQFCNFYKDSNGTIYASKLDRIVRDVKANVDKKRRCIIFSVWLKSIQHMSKLLNAYNIKHEIITGALAGNKRPIVIQNYNSNKTPVLLISKAANEGIDLKETYGVYVTEPQWNEEQVNQVIGRARRYKSHKAGGKDTVHVYRYYASSNDPDPDSVVVDQYLKSMAEKKQIINELFMSQINTWSSHIDQCVDVFGA